MTKTRHLIASAPIAIAAMAALQTMPASAQEAPVSAFDSPFATPAPIVIAPEAPASAALPAIPSEATSTTPIAAEPKVLEVQPVEVENVAEPEPARVQPAPVRSTSSARTPAPADASTAAMTDSVEEPLVSEALPPLAAAAPAPAVGETEFAPVPEPIRDTSSAALLFALLGLGGIGLAAFLVLRRRRRDTVVPIIERPVVASPMTLDREPVVTAYDEAPLREAAVEPSYSKPAGDLAVPLPAQLPESRGERGRLLQRMIDARPDRANPFRSRKARAKRARLILQSIGTRFTNRKPGIDLSQYTHVWPELRGWRPATA